MSSTGEKSSHPSYASIGISRISSGKNSPLFGSSIKHSTFIRLRIQNAVLNRNYHEDRHQSLDSIIEVDMSPTQFAEFVTSMNMGEGVPCTIRRLNGATVPEPPLVSKREQFVNEFRKHTNNVASKFDDLIDEMTEMAAKASVGKAERAEFLKKLKFLRQVVGSDTPFVAEQFNEQMEKTVHEAKGEVEAFISNIISKHGLESLKSGQIALE